MIKYIRIYFLLNKPYSHKGLENSSYLITDLRAGSIQL
jgi:hypothetical protein